VDDLQTNLTQVLNEMEITIADIPPSIAGLLEPNEIKTLKTMLIGGETTSQQVISKWANEVELLNFYGPTEVTISCMVNRIINKSCRGSTIGIPFPQTKAFILDQDLNSVKDGDIGELCFAGPQLSRGYLNVQDSQAFVAKVQGHDRIYRTGDLARRNSDGAFEFIGRIDTQMKINGYRVEAIEVENAILNASGIKQVTVGVMNRSRSSVRNVLVAWLVKDGSSCDYESAEWTFKVKELITKTRQACSIVLPRYMIPTIWIPVKEIPLTNNGKVNFKELVAFTETLSETMLQNFQSSESVLPSIDNDESPLSDAEVTLINVWAKLFSLDRKAIQKNDSFFGLGGDSILAIQVSKYLRTYGYYLTVSQIFSKPILFQMARNMVKKEELKNLESNKCDHEEPFDLLKSAHESSLSVLKEALENYNINIGSVEDVYPASPLQEGVVALI
jgi:hypothetical protein